MRASGGYARRLPAPSPGARGINGGEARDPAATRLVIGAWSVHLSDDVALPGGLFLSDQEVDVAGGGGHHLRGDFVDHHFAEQLPARHLLAIADEPGGEHSLGSGILL
jgi:hypothetical protein